MPSPCKVTNPDELTRLPFQLIAESELERLRAQTFWYKEPETIAWIGSFGAEDVFWDVGANIGIYSLYCAAMHLGARIHAFEPSFPNFTRLQANISRNGFTNIGAFQIAVSDVTERRKFSDTSNMYGASGGQLDTVLPVIAASYSVWAMTLDTLTHTLGCPTHIKIDIDGQEGRVVRGMEKTLQHPALRSVLIELDSLGFSPVSARICRTFTAAGFTQKNRFNTHTPHSRTRRAAEGIAVENVVFTREP